MKQLINKIKTIFSSKPSNAFLLFLTGFFFTQFILVNILYVKNPFGGWVTGMGVFTNASILFACLLALSVCLIALWLSAVKQKKSKQSSVIKAAMVQTTNTYPPIDFPKGSTVAVVLAYPLV